MRPLEEPRCDGIGCLECGGRVGVCCSDAYDCYKKNDQYSQCRKSCKDDDAWECSEDDDVEAEVSYDDGSRRRLSSSYTYTFCELFDAAGYATNLTASAALVMEEEYPGTRVAGDAAAYGCDDDALTISLSLRTYNGTGQGDYPPPSASASASLHGKMAAMRPPPPPPSRRALLSLDSATAISEFDDAYAIANLSYVSIPPSDDYVAPPTNAPTVPSDDATLDGATLRAGLSFVAGAVAAALSL